MSTTLPCSRCGITVRVGVPVYAIPNHHRYLCMSCGGYSICRGIRCFKKIPTHYPTLDCEYCAETKELCEKCNRRYSRLKFHKCQTKICPVCSKVVSNYRLHMRKRHPQLQHMLKSTVLPACLMHVVSSYLTPPDIVNCCIICSQQKSILTTGDNPYHHNHQYETMSVSSQRHLRKRRLSAIQEAVESMDFAALIEEGRL